MYIENPNVTGGKATTICRPIYQGHSKKINIKNQSYFYILAKNSWNTVVLKIKEYEIPIHTFNKLCVRSIDGKLQKIAEKN